MNVHRLGHWHPEGSIINPIDVLDGAPPWEGSRTKIAQRSGAVLKRRSGNKSMQREVGCTAHQFGEAVVFPGSPFRVAVLVSDAHTPTRLWLFWEAIKILTPERHTNWRPWQRTNRSAHAAGPPINGAN